jgi:hypothetical protein
MIGRKRIRQGLADRLGGRQADGTALNGEIDHHDRILLDDADQHDDANHGND